MALRSRVSRHDACHDAGVTSSFHRIPRERRPRAAFDRQSGKPGLAARPGTTPGQRPTVERPQRASRSDRRVGLPWLAVHPTAGWRTTRLLALRPVGEPLPSRWNRAVSFAPVEPRRWQSQLESPTKRRLRKFCKERWRAASCFDRHTAEPERLRPRTPSSCLSLFAFFPPQAFDDLIGNGSRRIGP